jgi:hypothetical protein
MPIFLADYLILPNRYGKISKGGFQFSAARFLDDMLKKAKQIPEKHLKKLSINMWN